MPTFASENQGLLYIRGHVVIWKIELQNRVVKTVSTQTVAVQRTFEGFRYKATIELGDASKFEFESGTGGNAMHGGQTTRFR
jgi:hypothetical protein